MGNYQKRIEITDEETGEVFGLNAGTLVNDVRQVLLSKRRGQMMAAIWKDLTEDQQRDEIVGMTQLAENLVDGIVDLVAAGGKDVIHAKFDSATLKNGAIKVVLNGNADDEALVSLNRAGTQTLKIVRIDHGQFDQHRDDLNADPDQPSMFGDEDEQPEEMSDEEIEEIGKEMDADLDGIEEPDDLHDEAEETEPASDEKVAGYHARMEGFDSQTNPHDIDSPEREEWYLGWKEADESDEAPDILMRYDDEKSDTDEASADQEPEKDDSDSDEADSDGDKPAEDREKALMQAMSEGQEARLKDAGPDENPYDGGTDEHGEWAKGYQLADEDVQSVIQAGRDAKAEGQKKSECPWKKGSDAERFWLQGYDQAKNDA